MPLRIHAILDDHSRYVVALAARHTERESEMLALLVQAMRRYGAPDALYLDKGPTYVGETLSTACGRLGIGLIHAKPYDPQSRGARARMQRSTCHVPSLCSVCGSVGSKPSDGLPRTGSSCRTMSASRRARMALATSWSTTREWN